MRYTRYNYEKKNNKFKNLIFAFAMLLLLALGVGTGMSKLLFKDGGNRSLIPNLKNAEDTSKDTAKSNESVSYAIFQGGYYSKKEGAEETNNKFDSFVVQDGDKFRVIITVVKDEEAEKISEDLKKDSISFIKNNANIKKDDLCNDEIAESVEALMQFTKKFNEPQVKSIKTAELKKWSSDLKKPEKDASNIGTLEEINKYIQAMPEEFKKENQKELTIFIYNIVAKFKI